ncbi:hypothetical protein HP439_01360 [Sphingobacterium shayense]|uniref:hypothetical protein n=1 Tax=Sphingobacterium shayense TaxID=626343 RepID=UPI0015564569|nr:hypothetical protein [Sphingobacterium shayense]NQD69370.1 hypothetical protein [Sphingobacterium shayense]
MNFDIIKLEDLKKADHIPKIVDDQVEEPYFVNYGERTVGVGLYLPNSDHCVLALVGDSLDSKKIIGYYGSSDEHYELVLHGLRIAFEGYLRSFKGDTVIGDMEVDD